VLFFEEYQLSFKEKLLRRKASNKCNQRLVTVSVTLATVRERGGRAKERKGERGRVRVVCLFVGV